MRSRIFVSASTSENADYPDLSDRDNANYQLSLEILWTILFIFVTGLCIVFAPSILLEVFIQWSMSKMNLHSKYLDAISRLQLDKLSAKLDTASENADYPDLSDRDNANY